MSEYLEIGSSPPDERCIQTTDKDPYLSKQRRECNIFVDFLRRYFGSEPEGAQLAVKGFPHDFGTYYEVVCYFDDNLMDSVEYAFKIEGECPEKWDQEAIDQLKAEGLWDDPLRK